MNDLKLQNDLVLTFPVIIMEHFSLLRIFPCDIVFTAMQIHEKVLEHGMSDVLYHYSRSFWFHISKVEAT